MRLGVVFDEIDRHGVAEVAGISPAMRRGVLPPPGRDRRRDGPPRRRTAARAARVATLTTRKAKPKAIIRGRAASGVARPGAGHSASTCPRLSASSAPRAAGRATTSSPWPLPRSTPRYDRGDVIRAVARAARQGASARPTSSPGPTPSSLGDQAVPLGRRPVDDARDPRAGSAASSPSPSSLPTRGLDRGPAGRRRGLADRPSLSAEQRRMVEQLCSQRPAHRRCHRPRRRPARRSPSTPCATRSRHPVTGSSAPRSPPAPLGNCSRLGHPRPPPRTLCSEPSTAGSVRLRPGDVLVVDEAGMLGTRLIAASPTRLPRAEAKLIAGRRPETAPRGRGRRPVRRARDPRPARSSSSRTAASATRKNVSLSPRCAHGRTEFAVRRLDRARPGHRRDTTATRCATEMVTDWLGPTARPAPTS